MLVALFNENLGGRIQETFHPYLAALAPVSYTHLDVYKRQDLGYVDMPILNIFAEQDHLVPPDASRALGKLAGSNDYTELSFKGGHIGIYVSSRAQREVPSAIHEWLDKRSR